MMVSGLEQQFGRQKEWTKGSPTARHNLMTYRGLANGLLAQLNSLKVQPDNMAQHYL
jgi:hypothetical protein